MQARKLLLVMALSAAAVPPPARTGERVNLTLDGEGGEAWSFTKRVAGTIPYGHCDTITIASPAGAVQAKRSGAQFIATVPLNGGKNEVRAECRDGAVLRGISPAQHWTVRLRDAPKAEARLVTGAEGIVLDGSSSETAPRPTAPLIRWQWRAWADNPAPLGFHGAETARVSVPPPATDGDYHVTLRVTDALGRSDKSTLLFRVRGGVATAVDLAYDHPSWIENAVIYGAVPALFGPRGLVDITAHLDAIAALGASVLWLAPVTASPSGDFGYAVTDPFAVRAAIGGADALHALVAAAHARGIRVILDFVANHLSDQSAYYRDAARHGAASPYYDFFDRDAAGTATHYFDWNNLENLNYADPEVQNYVIAAAAHWVRDFHVDGFRVDAAWAVRERAPDFWPRWRAELKRIDPDLLLLAEASARDPWYARHGFDAAYDWTDKPGEWAWSDAFTAGASTAARLRAALAADARGTPIFRFLDNNDTGERFISRYGVDRLRVAAAMLLTLPGIPSIYMGEATGAAFEPYHDPAPLTWQDHSELFGYFARLAQLRHAEPALRGRGMMPLATSQPDTVLAYLRPAAVRTDDVLVLLNYSDVPAHVVLAGDGLASLFGVPLTDCIAGTTITIDPATRTVALPAWGARVLRRAIQE